MSETVRSLMADLMAWHINRDSPTSLLELRERVVAFTGREELSDIRVDDIGLHAKLIDAVMDAMDAPNPHT